MNNKVIGLFICILLLANISIVLAMPEEKAYTNEKTVSYIFSTQFDQEHVKKMFIELAPESKLLHGNINRMNPNLAPNPSFEEGDTTPLGWTYYSFNANGIFHWDSNYSHSGEKSVGSLNLTYKPNYSVQLICKPCQCFCFKRHIFIGEQC